MNWRNRFVAHIALLLVAALSAAPALAADQKKDEPAKQEQSAKDTKKDAGQQEAKKQDKKTESDIAAKVNGKPIAKIDVDRAAKSMTQQMQHGGGAQAEKQAHEAALNQLIAAELLYQKASEKKLDDIDKKVEERIKESRDRFKTQEEFDKALKQSGLSEKELKELMRKDTVINTFIEKDIRGGIKVTEDDAKKFYQENIDKFKRPESAAASHILVGVDESAKPEDKAKAKQKAEDLLKKIKEGADFAEIAKKESTCPSAANGGDLGEFGRGQMVKPFEDAAFGLKPGEVSGVVETQFGYHLIKLKDKKEAATVSFDEVKDKITSYLQNQKTQQAVTSLIDELKKNGKVETFE